MRSIFLTAAMGLFLMLGACSHMGGKCCKDGACKMEKKADCDCGKHGKAEKKEPVAEEKK